jgi:DNA-binding NarL/FixJ family response regulator
LPEALTSRALTVLIADDHPLVRDGICHALTQHGVDVCAQAADAPGAVAAALRTRPDVCLLDIEMPGNGIVAAQEIAEQLPETAVVMLTVSDDERDLLASILAGAVGYLLKDSDPDRLAYALQGVLSGEAALPRRLMTRVLNHVRASETRRRLGLRMPRGVQLTDREWDVLELMHDEMTTRDVATRLSVSPVTVRRHLSAAVAKLGVSDRDAALAMIRDLNVTGPGLEDGSEPWPSEDERVHTRP